MIGADKPSLRSPRGSIVIHVNHTGWKYYSIITYKYLLEWIYLITLHLCCVCVFVSPLTVGAAVDFYAQANPTLLAPVQRDEPQEARHDSLLQLVANRALWVGVPGEGLWTHRHTHMHTMKLNTSKPQACSQTSSFGTRSKSICSTHHILP